MNPVSTSSDLRTPEQTTPPGVNLDRSALHSDLGLSYSYISSVGARRNEKGVNSMIHARDAGAVSEQDMEQLTALFRLLSDRTRLNILLLLADGERNVTNLCNALNLPQPTVSHHLGLLRMNNVIGCRRNGKQVFYGMNGRVDVPSDGTALEIGVEKFTVRIARKPLN